MGSFDKKQKLQVSNYTQSAVIQTSQSIYVPDGTKRIEALLCGGGGGGAASGSGGFGGLQIFEIPLTGKQLDLVIGAGGAAAAIGGTTTVSSANTLYAAVGGGGSGNGAGNGRFGGCGGGGATLGGQGGPPFPGKLLWSALDNVTRSGNAPGLLITTAASFASPYVVALGMAGRQVTNGEVNAAAIGTDANLGWGSGGGTYDAGGTSTLAGVGGGVSQQVVATSAGRVGTFGAGGGRSGSTNIAAGGTGGSLATVSVWGLTGFAGGAGATDGVGSGCGGGGGGMLAVGGAATLSTTGGAGGNGGGGGGCGNTGGAGGNGFVVLRFYF